MAITFLLWIGGVICSALAWRKAKAALAAFQLRWAAVCIAVAAAACGIAIVNMPARPATAFSSAVNDPIGVGQGIHPGRVVWVHDPAATNWVGTDRDGTDIGDGYWWQSDHTDQAAVDRMMSQAIRAVAGESTDEAAWDAIFKHFNATRGKGAVQYRPGEKITIKVNLTTANSVHGNIDAEGNQLYWLGWVNTSPQAIVALLRQLVYGVGVAQEDISVGDPSAFFPNHYWDRCNPEFSNVRYLSATGELSRHAVVSSSGTDSEVAVLWSTPDAEPWPPDFLPVSYAEASYLINMACLKGHGAGVTLCAKNHYGSFIRRPSEAGFYDMHSSLPGAGWSPGLGHYRVHTDIMTHELLGGKTILNLIDGLYGGYPWNGRPSKWQMAPFFDDWPSSIFASEDQVAIDSVGFDFLLNEWPTVVDPPALEGGTEDYLHEAALAHQPPSGTVYDPDGSPYAAQSLGVHEHWDNEIDKRYTNDLGTGTGIQLLRVVREPDGDSSGDGVFGLVDHRNFADCLSGPAMLPAPALPGISMRDCLNTFDADFDLDVDLDDTTALLSRFGS